MPLRTKVLGVSGTKVLVWALVVYWSGIKGKRGLASGG